MRQYRDITGNKYGKLIALEYIRKNEKGKTGWICSCECGNKLLVPSSRLFNGNTKSCGCIRNPFNLKAGDIVGRLTLLNQITSRNNIKLWLCKCQCGKESSVFQSNLQKGKTKSCGCLYKESRTLPRINSIGFKETKGKFWSNIKSNARIRGLEMNLSIEEAWNKFIEQNKQCALTGVKLSFEDKTASLDRIDSIRGYEVNNIQWVHKTINLIKMNLKQEEFIKWCGLVVQQNGILKS